MADLGGFMVVDYAPNGWMCVISLLAIVGFFAAVERTVTLGRIRLGSLAGKRRLDELLDHPRFGDLRETGTPAGYPIDRVLAAASSHFSGTQAEIACALELEARREARKLYHRLSLLGLVVVTAPLCGFAGTVSGITGMWYQCGLSTPPIAVGISEALVTTAAGLAVAIPAQLVLRTLRVWAHQTEADLENAVSRVLLHAKLAQGDHP